MRALGWILTLPVALLVMVFAVANRHEVRLDLWPLPWAVDLPAFLLVLGPLLMGGVIGAVLTWLAGHGARRRARDQGRRAQSLERQLASARTQEPTVALPPPDRAA